MASRKSKKAKKRASGARTSEKAKKKKKVAPKRGVKAAKVASKGRTPARARAKRSSKKSAKVVKKTPVKMVAKKKAAKKKTVVKKTPVKMVRKKVAKKKATKKAVKKVVKKTPVKMVSKKAVKKVVKKTPVKMVPKKPAKKKPVKKRPSSVPAPAASPAPQKKPKKPKKPKQHRFPEGFVPVTPQWVPMAPPRKREKRGRWNDQTEKTAETLREILTFVKSIVTLQGWDASRNVQPYDDNRIDADLYVEIPAHRSSFAEIRQMVLTIDDTLANIGKLPDVYISCNWKLAPEAQERRKYEDKPYQRFQGALRVGVSYQRASDAFRSKADIKRKYNARSENFATAIALLENIFQSHGLAPIAFIVRMAWSADGLCHRRR
jgi:hypothetical protein